MPTRRAVGSAPGFSSISRSTVVPNFSAIEASVSPLRTAYADGRAGLTRAFLGACSTSGAATFGLAAYPPWSAGRASSTIIVTAASARAGKP